MTDEIQKIIADLRESITGVRSDPQLHPTGCVVCGKGHTRKFTGYYFALVPLVEQPVCGKHRKMLHRMQPKYLAENQQFLDRLVQNLSSHFLHEKFAAMVAQAKNTQDKTTHDLLLYLEYGVLEYHPEKLVTAKNGSKN